MDQLQLDKILQSIEGFFGQDTPFTDQPLSEDDLRSLQRVFGETGYQRYLQDQVNRQIIREYLTNAVVLGIIPAEHLGNYSLQAGTVEGRSMLSLHMLVSSVDQSADLPLWSSQDNLKALRPSPTSPPHMVLIES